MNVFIKRRTEERLGEILIKAGDITDKELEAALEKQKKEGGLIGGILVKMGFVNDMTIARALTEQYNLPFIMLENYDFNMDAINLIPYEKAVVYNMAALDVFGEILVVAMVNPLDKAAIESVEKLTGKKIKPFVTVLSSLTEAIEKVYAKKKQGKI